MNITVPLMRQLQSLIIILKKKQKIGNLALVCDLPFYQHADYLTELIFQSARTEQQW